MKKTREKPRVCEKIQRGQNILPGCSFISLVVPSDKALDLFKMFCKAIDLLFDNRRIVLKGNLQKDFNLCLEDGDMKWISYK